MGQHFITKNFATIPLAVDEPTLYIRDSIYAPRNDIAPIRIHLDPGIRAALFR